MALPTLVTIKYDLHKGVTTIRISCGSRRILQDIRHTDFDHQRAVEETLDQAEKNGWVVTQTTVEKDV